jgi:nitrate reductase NapAB chaperone NapD
MKYCSIILVLFLLAASPVMGQKKYLRKFYREQKWENHAIGFRIGVGGFMMRFASLIIPASVMDENGVSVKPMLSKIHKVKVYTLETSGKIPLERLRQTLIEKEQFEPLVEVRHQGSQIYLLNKGKGDNIGKMVVLIQSDGEFVMVYLRTNLHMEDINQFVQQVAKNN